MKIIVIVGLLAILANSQDFIEFYSGFTGTNFDQTGWTVTNALSTTASDYIYDCSGTKVFGGPKAFGLRAIITQQFQLPPHYQIKVQVEIWKFDKWSTERMFFYLDNYLWETMFTASTDGTAICKTPAGGNQFSVKVDQVLTHNQASVFIAFQSSVLQAASRQSWGIRNLKLLYMPCPSQCGTCFSGDAVTCQMWLPAASSWILNTDNSDGWSLKSGTIKTSTCSGIPIIGGPGNFGNNVQLQRTLSKLQPHYRLKIVAQFWKVDNWADDSAQLWIDNLLKWSQIVSLAEDKEFYICDKAAAGGVDGTEKIININYETPHNYGAALVKFTSTITKTSKQASWGIRQFQAYVASCSTNCATCTGPDSSECTACLSPYVLLDPEDGKGTGCVLLGDWVQFEQDFQQGQWTANADWKVVGGTNGPDFTNTCGDIQMFGGADKTAGKAQITRTFTLPPHKRIRIAFEAWKIDDWFGEDYIVTVDGLKVWGRSFGFGDPGLADICGGAGYENYAQVDFIIGHEATTLNLQISTTLGDNANKLGSFALRQFKIYYEKPDTCATLYTECNYTGKSYNMCEDIPNFQLAKYPSKIKSLQIPAGAKVVLFDEMSYIGKTIEYTENQKCIESYNYKFLQNSNKSSQVLTANKQ